MSINAIFFAIVTGAAISAAPAFAQHAKPTQPNVRAPDPVKMVEKKPDVKPDPAKAAQAIKTGVDQLDRKSYAEAVKSFNDAYGLGDGDGAFYIGRMVELGVGLQPDFNKARALYLAAADKGSAKALNRLGLMSFRGEHALQDYVAAAELICKAADRGDADGQFNCAGLYAEGKGVAKDLGKAIGWYGKAAEKGHIGALNALGFAYRDGVGVAADLGKAQSYFEKAAAKGNPVALFELGAMYESGKPMTRDLGRAHLYYNLAAARQHPAASEALQRVSAAMPSSDVGKAQAEAKNWKAAP